MVTRMYQISGENVKRFDEGMTAILEPFFTHSARVRLVMGTLGKEVYGTNMGLISLIQQASNCPEAVNHCVRLAESMGRSLRYQEELMESIEAILMDMKVIAGSVATLLEGMDAPDRQALPIVDEAGT